MELLLEAMAGHPAYQQIMTAFADRARPLRARDLCQTLDLPIVSKNVENIRSKPKNAWSAAASSTRPSRACSPSPARNSPAHP